LSKILPFDRIGREVSKGSSQRRMVAWLNEDSRLAERSSLRGCI
jgi:hypothetical protein